MTHPIKSPLLTKPDGTTVGALADTIQSQFHREAVISVGGFGLPNGVAEI
jgi:hypothetical protein